MCVAPVCFARASDRFAWMGRVGWELISGCKVYAELTSREVLTMEWVEGARLSDRAMLDNYGLEPSRLVDTMVIMMSEGLYTVTCFVV